MPGSDRDFAKIYGRPGRKQTTPLSVILSQQFLLRRIQKTIMQPNQIVIRIYAGIFAWLIARYRPAFLSGTKKPQDER